LGRRIRNESGADVQFVYGGSLDFRAAIEELDEQTRREILTPDGQEVREVAARLLQLPRHNGAQRVVLVVRGVPSDLDCNSFLAQHLTDSDDPTYGVIEVFDRPCWWVTGGNLNLGLDFQATLMHEGLHFLGFKHSNTCEATSGAESIMRQGPSGRAPHLHPLDISCMRKLYGYARSTVRLRASIRADLNAAEPTEDLNLRAISRVHFAGATEDAATIVFNAPTVLGSEFAASATFVTLVGLRVANSEKPFPPNRVTYYPPAGCVTSGLANNRWFVVMLERTGQESVVSTLRYAYRSVMPGPEPRRWLDYQVWAVDEESDGPVESRGRFVACSYEPSSRHVLVCYEHMDGQVRLHPIRMDDRGAWPRDEVHHRLGVRAFDGISLACSPSLGPGDLNCIMMWRNYEDADYALQWRMFAVNDDGSLVLGRIHDEGALGGLWQPSVVCVVGVEGLAGFRYVYSVPMAFPDDSYMMMYGIRDNGVTEQLHGRQLVARNGDRGLFLPATLGTYPRARAAAGLFAAWSE
jgi:hypothetical protein